MKFSLQLQKIMEHFALSTTELADKIFVPKATISHLISERNKPSLEFITKLHTHFPTLNLEWLIYGNEPFLIEEKKAVNHQAMNDSDPFKIDENFADQTNLNITESKNIIENVVVNKEKDLSFTPKKIDSIVIFYNDGSFKQYHS